MDIVTILVLIWLHFTFDLILQPQQLARNKSSDITWLGVHCLIYTAPFLYWGWFFALIVGLLHALTDFVTDFLTSRGTVNAWDDEKKPWLLVLIGLDHAIHLTVLFGMYVYLFGSS